MTPGPEPWINSTDDDPGAPSPASWLREAVRDGYGWASAVVELQKKALPNGLFGRTH